MDNFFDILADLTLFKGISQAAITHMVGKYPLNFRKFADGETIVAAGEQCRSLIFVLSGRVRVTSVDRHFEIRHTLPPHSVLMAEYLFGRNTSYPATACAIGPVSIMEISKTDYFQLLHSDSVFILNYLNHLSCKAQKLYDFVAGPSFLTTLGCFVDAFTEHSSTDIHIYSSFNIPNELGIHEHLYENTLNMLVAQGIVDSFDAEKVVIANRPAFLQATLS